MKQQLCTASAVTPDSPDLLQGIDTAVSSKEQVAFLKKNFTLVSLAAFAVT
jgi:hypothetical protein